MVQATHTPSTWRPDASPSGAFGAGQSERCIEAPWANNWLSDRRDILDIGFAMSHADWLRMLLARREAGATLTASDIITPDRVAQRYPDDLRALALSTPVILGDIRTAPIPAAAFDTVTCISTIEHIGFDAKGATDQSAFSRWATLEETPASRDPNVTREVMAALARALKPGGLALVTVPMGTGGAVPVRDSLGFYTRQEEYNAASWGDIAGAPGFKPLEQRFFTWLGPDGWREVGGPDELTGQTAWLTPHATGVALAALERM